MKRGLFKGLFFPRFSLNDLISGIRSFPKLKLIVGILLFIVLDGAYIYVNYTIAGGEDSVIAGKLKEKPNKNEFPMTSDYIVAGAFVSGKEDVGGYYLFSFNCGKPYGQNDFSCNISALQFSESPKGVCEVSLVQTARRRAVREGDGLKIPFQSVYGALEIYLSKEESKLVRSKINDDSRGLFGNEKLETPLEISFLVESARDRTEPAYNESFPEIHKKMQGLLPVCGMGSTSYSI